MPYRTYYPVFLDVKGRPCLVVGGGSIGLEKASGLMAAGAKVKLVSPDVLPELEELANLGKLEWHPREFEPSDLKGQFLVFGATDDNEVNQRVANQADELGKLANAVDDPAYCNFILAALISQGPMTIAVSSAGCSPALAQQIRNRIAGEILSPSVGALAELLGDWRPQTKACIDGYRERKTFWEAVIAGATPEWVANGDLESANATVAEELTRHCTNRCALKGVVCQKSLAGEP